MRFHPRFHSLLSVRDEGDIIAQSLEHQLLWADCIHVFDTGSTDETWNIVQDFAQKKPERFHLIGRRPVYFNDTEVRSYLFAESRCVMQPGDWVLRCDADEFHHILPPDFVRYHMTWYEGSAYHQYFDYHFTSDDLLAWEAGRESLADRVRPIKERRRFFTISQEHEPRMFRYRRNMQWPQYASFPLNAGFVAKQRLPIRHYPHRDPVQMEQRCKLRAQMLAYPPSRATWAQADIHHWRHQDWRSLIMQSSCPELKQSQPVVSQDSSHLPSGRKRFVQFLAHLLVVPWLDHLRHQQPVGSPHPMRSEQD